MRPSRFVRRFAAREAWKVCGGIQTITETVTEEEILSKLRELTPERWFEVLDFIGYLKYRPTERQLAQPRELTARDLLQSELVGLWADREDIGDSLVFARRLRWQAEHRWETANGSA